MKPEEKARVLIDQMLEATGWVIQDRKRINFSAGLGIAIRELNVASGFSDYALFVDKQAVGIMEAKKVGFALSGVIYQTDKYVEGFKKKYKKMKINLAFCYESTGIETFFRDLRDPDPKSRKIFTFHTPQMLEQWLGDSKTLRTRLNDLAGKKSVSLFTSDIKEAHALEFIFDNLAKNRQKMILLNENIGQTVNIISILVYNLLSQADVKNILILGNSKELSKLFQELGGFIAPSETQKLEEKYKLKKGLTLISDILDSSLYFDEIDKFYHLLSQSTKYLSKLEYNSEFPISSFSFILSFECEKIEFPKWKQIIDYFDSFIIGISIEKASDRIIGALDNNKIELNQIE